VPDRQLCLNGLNPLLVGLESGDARGSSNPSDLRWSRCSRLPLVVRVTALALDTKIQGSYRGRDGAPASRSWLSTGRFVFPSVGCAGAVGAMAVGVPMGHWAFSSRWLRRERLAMAGGLGKRPGTQVEPPLNGLDRSGSDAEAGSGGRPARAWIGARAACGPCAGSWSGPGTCCVPGPEASRGCVCQV
jgi:hypothetical protein